jgi:transcriptional regulator with XRE-family HTH domain
MCKQTPIYKQLRDYVYANGLSQKVIATNMGCTESQVSLLLNGKRRLTIEDYLLFCRAIAVSPTRFIPTI